MRATILCLGFGLLLILPTGCATQKGDEVSSIPWNRPQTWEGAGGLGGFRPPGSQTGGPASY